MLALVVLESLVLAILTVVVIGLLRSHGDVLRRLHELGVPLGDDGADATGAGGAVAGGSGGAGGLPVGGPHGGQLDPEGADIARRLQAGVAPPKATGTEARDVSGVTPSGGAVSVAVFGRDRLTLLAFLSSGCSTCAGFWQALRDGQRLAVNGRDVRVVVVTGAPEHEHPRAVAALAPADITVVMSGEAWQAYAVPATPYFVLVDGARGVVGEGSASGWSQLAGLLERAVADGGFAPTPEPQTVPATGPAGGAAPARVSGARASVGPAPGASDGPGREQRADAALLAAGIGPGDQQLYAPPLEPEP